MAHNSRKDKLADSSSDPKSTAIEVIEEQMTVRVQVTNVGGTMMSSGGSSVDIIVTEENNSNDPRWEGYWGRRGREGLVVILCVLMSIGWMMSGKSLE